MASRAFSARFSKAVVSWLASTKTGGSSSWSIDSISICSPNVWRNSFAASTSNVLTSVLYGCSGCLRAKASKRCVISTPRVAGFVDELHGRGELRIVGHALGEDFDRAGNHGQHVVEVMGDATGELPDRLHLLRHPQLLVERALFRKVLDECIEYVSAATAQGCHFQLDLNLSPVSAQRIHFDALAQNRASAALQKPCDPGRVASAEPLRHD